MCALASTAAPLLVYSLTLAVFGMPHVLYELRYVARRFGPELGARLRLGLGVGLGGVLVLRGGRQAEWWSGTGATQAELGLVLALCGLALPTLWRAGGGARAWGAGLVGLFALGVAISPVHTLFALAMAHNWTPVGFLLDAHRGEGRGRVLLGLGLAFGVIPLLIASGLPMDALARLGLYLPQQSVLPTGPLAGHFSAFLAPDWRERPWTEAAFQALVFAQCMHYVAVLGLLPRLRRAPEGWPEVLAVTDGSRFLLLTVGAALLSFALFNHDFAMARGIYSLPAGVHAWVELPLLLLALLPLPQPNSSPTPKEAALATAEISSARLQGSASAER